LRTAKSYDSSDTSAPILRVSYDPDSAPENACIYQTVQAGVSNDDNDAEEASDGSVDLGSSDLELIDDGGDQTVGIRFTSINIPKDADIVSAELIFVPDETAGTHSGSTNLTIKGEDVDNSAIFTSANENISSRTTTSASVSWSPSAWESWEGQSIEEHSSSDLATIVQTIVNRAGWEAGNAMSFIITGSGKRRAESFDGSNAALAPRLRIVVNGELAQQTVRQKLLETVDNLNWKSGTPILDVMYEAALYYRGEDVYYGRTRGFGEVRGDSSLGDDYGDRYSEFTRISHPLSWNGGGTIVQPDGCTDDNPNSENCIDEHISGTATYISPITESCQANYQILLSDGEGYGTNSVSEVNSMMTDTPTCSGHDGCAEVLSGFLHTKDQMSGDDFENDQTIATYTIGFNTGGIDPSFLEDIASTGGGSFHTADTAVELADVFQTILSEVLSSTSSFSAPTVSVNAFNKLFHDDDVYFSTFLPDSTGRWAGNLKKYKICESGDTSCTTGDIIDQDGESATGADGQFLDTSKSFWSASDDGKEVQVGGAGAEITYPRKVYIEDGDVFTLLTEAKGDASDGDYDSTVRALLDPGTSLTNSEYLNLVKWILGKDIRDEDDDNSTTDTRWAFADALHSQPLVVTYGKEGSNSIKKIFITHGQCRNGSGRMGLYARLYDQWPKPANDKCQWGSQIWSGWKYS